MTIDQTRTGRARKHAAELAAALQRRHSTSHTLETRTEAQIPEAVYARLDAVERDVKTITDLLQALEGMLREVQVYALRHTHTGPDGERMLFLGRDGVPIPDTGKILESAA